MRMTAHVRRRAEIFRKMCASGEWSRTHMTTADGNSMKPPQWLLQAADQLRREALARKSVTRPTPAAQPPRPKPKAAPPAEPDPVEPDDDDDDVDDDEPEAVLMKHKPKPESKKSAAELAYAMGCGGAVGRTPPQVIVPPFKDAGVIVLESAATAARRRLAHVAGPGTEHLPADALAICALRATERR